MSVVWALILFSTFGALISMRSRAAAPCAIFAAIAVGLLLVTPQGQGFVHLIQTLAHSTDVASQHGVTK